VVNPNIEDQKFLSILTSVKKRINIAKIKTNYDDLHSENGHWIIPKTPWHEGICHLCDTKRVEYENHFLLECPCVYPNYISISKYFSQYQPS
jgi:hypothetical protein